MVESINLLERQKVEAQLQKRLGVAAHRKRPMSVFDFVLVGLVHLEPFKYRRGPFDDDVLLGLLEGKLRGPPFIPERPFQDEVQEFVKRLVGRAKNYLAAYGAHAMTAVLDAWDQLQVWLNEVHGITQDGSASNWMDAV
jgi:hypothetical protein